MARIWFVVFFGKAGERGEHAHESPAVMTTPLILLSFFAMTAGLLALNYGPSYEGFGTFLYYLHPEPYHFNLPMALLSILLAGAGLLFGWSLYLRGTPSPAALRQRFANVHTLL